MATASGMRLDIEVFGDRQISRGFTAVAARLKDARASWHRIVDQLVEAERRQFDSEGGYASGGWTPLAPSTRAAKQALGLDNGILNRTGRLRESLAVRGGRDQTLELHPSWMVFGSTVPYGRFHQAGSGVPQRKPFELTDGDKREMVRTLQKQVLGIFG